MFTEEFRKYLIIGITVILLAVIIICSKMGSKGPLKNTSFKLGIILSESLDSVNDWTKRQFSFAGNIFDMKKEVEKYKEENKFVFVALEDNQMMLEQINGHWNTGKLEYPFGRGINFEMSVSDVDSIYKRIIEAGINPFVEMESVTYRTGESELTQKQFLVLDPDGYLLRFVEG